MPSRYLTIRVHGEKKLLWFLVAGFGAVILVMLVSGFLLLRAMRMVGEAAQRLTDRQLEQMEQIDKLQREQANVGELLYRMVEDPNRAQSPRHLAEIAPLRAAVGGLVTKATQQDLPKEESDAWKEVGASSTLLFDAMESSLSGDAGGMAQIAPNHRRFVASMARLMDSNYQEAQIERAEEIRGDAKRFTSSAILLAAAAAVAMVGAFTSVVFTVKLFGTLERQADTLRQLSLHILEEQESSARRFSQELHDEFGQTLNAIESTLAVVRVDDPDSRLRLEDAKAMVKESIANAREMSRLLRPSILDDFGLDAVLRELASGFSQRTGIVVDYISTFRGRLPADVETHLFRIAQEALTNVSRHSSARRVTVELKRDGGNLRFRIVDDGEGMSGKVTGKGLGLIGMAERAYAAGGTITMQSLPGSGLEIVVTVPVEGAGA